MKEGSPASRDVPMEVDGGEAMEEIKAGEVTVKGEEDDKDEGAILNAIENAIRMAEPEEGCDVKHQEDVKVGTSAQQTFSTGMASTLNILWKQGILSTSTMDQNE